MREILFRGKRIDNGEWVEGFYFERKDTSGKIIESVIIEDAYEQIINGRRYICSNICNECYRVDHPTIGQYTGLKDKNGKKIFEGDIVVADGYLYVCQWDECNIEFGLRNAVESFGMCYVYPDVEVIGNFHDNPEIMEDEK